MNGRPIFVSVSAVKIFVRLRMLEHIMLLVFQWQAAVINNRRWVWFNAVAVYKWNFLVAQPTSHSANQPASSQNASRRKCAVAEVVGVAGAEAKSGIRNSSRIWQRKSFDARRCVFLVSGSAWAFLGSWICAFLKFNALPGLKPMRFQPVINSIIKNLAYLLSDYSIRLTGLLRSVLSVFSVGGWVEWPRCSCNCIELGPSGGWGNENTWKSLMLPGHFSMHTRIAFNPSPSVRMNLRMILFSRPEQVLLQLIKLLIIVSVSGL